MTQQFGKMTMKGKFQMKDDNIRSDMEMMGQTRTTIVRKDKSLVWILIPKRQQYMELPFSEETKNNPQFYQDKLESVATKQDLGSEEVNGYKCKKYLFTFNDQSRGTMTQWFSEELQFPIKMVNKGSNWEMTTEFSNIKEGGVNDALFQIPQGYTKMEKPAGMPGMMPPASGKPVPAPTADK